jgi:hypothetical protein
MSLLRVSIYYICLFNAILFGQAFVKNVSGRGQSFKILFGQSFVKSVPGSWTGRGQSFQILFGQAFMKTVSGRGQSFSSAHAY